MRVLHTADWHFGRTLEGRSRQAEHEQFVDELCRMVRSEKVDLVLLAGDVFDGVNPPAAAEELYCEALARLGDGGRRAVAVLAGNHDNPERLGAVRPLALEHGVTIFGYPSDDPGVHMPGWNRVQRIGAGPGWAEISVPGLEHTAVLLALAYPSEARLGKVLAETLAEGELQESYSAQVGQWFAARAGSYRPDAVRLAASHIFVAGGQESQDSERVIQVGGAYTVYPEVFPTGAQYVALGHLHRSQQMRAARVHTRYSGSPLAFNFSEAGQAKSVTLADLSPGDSEPRVEILPVSAGKPLVRWVAPMGIPQVESWVREGRDAGAWIDLEIHVREALRIDQVHSLRQMHPGFVQIRTELAEVVAEMAATVQRQVQSLEEHFLRFYAGARGGAEPAPELVRLFLELSGEVREPEVES